MDEEVSRRKFARELTLLTDQASEFARLRGWIVKEAAYPVLMVIQKHSRTGRLVGFKFHCDQWDEEPPSLSLFDPQSLAELGWEQWPRNGWAAGHPHPKTGKPFLCLPGIREYHTHDSHLNDKWDNLRGRASYTLLHIVERVRQKFEETDG